jgi:hypothetical protein
MSKENPSAPDLHQSEHQAIGNDKLTAHLTLLVNNETTTGETTNSNVETTLFTLSVPASACASILIEAELRFRNTRTTAGAPTCVWRIKEGAGVLKTVTDGLVNTTSGGSYIHTRLSVIITNPTAVARTITITGQMSAAQTTYGILGECARAWGII